MSLDYVIGVDLGQAQDYTAIAVLEREELDTGHAKSAFVGAGHASVSRLELETEAVYRVRHLERLTLGTPYPQQVERVTKLYQDVCDLEALRHRRARPQLVVDQTGVGRPVVDMLRQAGLSDLRAVSITAGDAVTREGRDYRVPKRELVSVLQVLLQSDRLTVAAGLPEAATLSREMLAFKVKFNARGHDSYGNDWRENDHDDMVLAVALAAWISERAVGSYKFLI